MAAVVAIHELAEVVVIANGVRAGRRTAFVGLAPRPPEPSAVFEPPDAAPCQDDCCT